MKKRPGSQVARQCSAKALYAGAIPALAYQNFSGAGSRASKSPEGRQDSSGTKALYAGAIPAQAFARVLELADNQHLKCCGLTAVWVRIPPRAH